MTDKEAAAKDWLTRNNYIYDEVKSMELLLEEMRARVNKSVAAPKEISVQTQPLNIQDERIAEIVDFEKKIESKRLYLEAMEKETKETIEKLNDRTLINILTFRYIYRRSWKYTADKMHYKETYIYELHTKALNKIYPIIFKGD